jgi:hypothetical protein
VPEARLEWHRRIQLVAKIQHYFKRQHLRPGFEQDLAGMLALLH